MNGDTHNESFNRRIFGFTPVTTSSVMFTKKEKKRKREIKREIKRDKKEGKKTKCENKILYHISYISMFF